MDEGEEEARRTRPIHHVIVTPGGMVAVFDEKGIQMSYYQGYWPEMRDRILAAYNGVIEMYLMAEQVREKGL